MFRFLLLIALTLASLQAKADLYLDRIEDIPGLGSGIELTPYCEGYPDQKFSQSIEVKAQNILSAIKCQDLERALKLSKKLQVLIKNEIAAGGGHTTTAYGECYDDRKCTQRSSSTTPTKDMCKASGGRGWIQTNPLPRGTCIAL